MSKSEIKNKREYTEQLIYSNEDDDIFVEREYSENGIHEYERFPVSQWGLHKKLDVSVHVVREISTDSFESPLKIKNYELPLTYQILDIPSAKYWYLKIEKQTFDIKPRFNPKFNMIKIFLRSVDTGITQQAPLPTSLFRKEDWEYLSIEKGKARELIDKNEILALWASKKCIGKYDYSLENYLQ